jgi:hypothetical protein
VLPPLRRFCEERHLDLHRDLGFPQELLKRAMHLDPDFGCLPIPAWSKHLCGSAGI